MMSVTVVYGALLRPWHMLGPIAWEGREVVTFGCGGLVPCVLGFDKIPNGLLGVQILEMYTVCVYVYASHIYIYMYIL